MKRILAFAIIILASLPLAAEIPLFDRVPAATLLLPHFEVDLSEPSGTSTVFSVTNYDGAPALAHVTLWTDRGIPTYSFDLYLVARDTVEVDLRLLFAGVIPPTGPATGFPGCDGVIPAGPMPAATVEGLRNAHTGAASSLLGGLCGTSSPGPLARGFITIDSTNQCAINNPTSVGYFVSGGGGIANNRNVLGGSYRTVQRPSGRSWGEALIAVEASATHDATNGAGDVTFYGRLLSGSGADNREPLPTTWMARYLLTGAATTSLVVWREPGIVAPFACGAPPAGLSTRWLVPFDHEEQFADVQGSKSAAFSLASQRLELEGGPITIPFDAGFLMMGLQLTTPSGAFGMTNQSYVATVIASDAGSAGLTSAFPLDKGVSPAVGDANFIFQCSDGVDNDGDGLIDFPADPGCESSMSNESPRCNNGIDDDGDGLIDFPDDPGCASASSFTESPQCNDGFDNDGDGDIDFPADPGCTSASGTNERRPCSDGVDNDGDGLIDFPKDPGCTSANGLTEAPACSDGLDNDADGQIDFPNDAGCESAGSTSEAPACSDGIDNDGDTLIDFPNDPGCASPASLTEAPACSDGADNDGDGLTDFPADPGCTSASGTDERRPCNDGVDNDGDGFVDYPEDPSCRELNWHTESPVCSNGWDDDADGLTDFPDDPGCESAADESELAGATASACSDGIDNDGDGLIDYPADPGCISRYDANEYNQ